MDDLLIVTSRKLALAHQAGSMEPDKSWDRVAERLQLLPNGLARLLLLRLRIW